MAASLENLSKMKENRSSKASLQEMKHGFTSSPQSKKRDSMTWKDSPLPTTKKKNSKLNLLREKNDDLLLGL
jgi:hypothetical protein